MKLYEVYVTDDDNMQDVFLKVGKSSDSVCKTVFSKLDKSKIQTVEAIEIKEVDGYKVTLTKS